MNEKETIKPTFLSNSPVTHTDGEKYLVLETSTKSTEMVVLKLSNRHAYLYHDGTFTRIDLDKDRTDGRYLTFGVLHNYIDGELMPAPDTDGKKDDGRTKNILTL